MSSGIAAAMVDSTIPPVIAPAIAASSDATAARSQRARGDPVSPATTPVMAPVR
jgi:hypothetical protein